jgi:hypothetical protein
MRLLTNSAKLFTDLKCSRLPAPLASSCTLILLAQGDSLTPMRIDRVQTETAIAEQRNVVLDVLRLGIFKVERLR